MEKLEEIETEAEALEATGRDWHVLAEIPPALRTKAVCRTVWALAFLPGMPFKRPEKFPSPLSLTGRLMLKRLMEFIPALFMTEDLCEATAGQVFSFYGDY